MKISQLRLPVEAEPQILSPAIGSLQGLRAIECADFPFEHVSTVAKLESWRKEIYRPVYHIHKWWAQRLGSVFRAVLIGTLSPQGTDILHRFYSPTRFPGFVIFDPFMGSGTTIGEALKLGGRVVGRDINPVACFLVRNALRKYRYENVIHTFQAIERDVAHEIRRYYRARTLHGDAEVLYYFWVKLIECPSCHERVDLFPTYIFAQDAYPKRRPVAWCLCPRCGGVNPVRYDADSTTCGACSLQFNPQRGPAGRTSATCRACGHETSIVDAVKAEGRPPSHRIYAKLVLHTDGTKAYLPADDYDHYLYAEAAEALKGRKDPYPMVPIQPGYNTDQVLNYGYTQWHQMFNERQLLCLSLLADRIREIADERMRELFTCLFSGMLEFNNMFTSYKGEGTGAVRHMFYHHILKPERMPLEANVWGTPASSGSFSGLFRSRILRALAYGEEPFEVRPTEKKGRKVTEKVFGLSGPMGEEPANTWNDFAVGKRLYLSCGDSSQTDLPAESIDAIVTDPPFFDNVHYSQLADFFFVWQRHILGSRDAFSAPTTRSRYEVQQTEARAFTDRLTGVLVECHRVLKNHGLLVFTYHHSRPEGWRALLEAVTRAGFYITATLPVKAEMSVAAPKHAAREPIDLDIVVVCRKRQDAPALASPREQTMKEVAEETYLQLRRLAEVGWAPSRNDVSVVVSAQLIKRLSLMPFPENALACWDECKHLIDRSVLGLLSDLGYPAKAHMGRVQTLALPREDLPT